MPPRKSAEEKVEWQRREWKKVCTERKRRSVRKSDRERERTSIRLKQRAIIKPRPRCQKGSERGKKLHAATKNNYSVEERQQTAVRREASGLEHIIKQNGNIIPPASFSLFVFPVTFTMRWWSTNNIQVFVKNWNFYIR